MMPASLRAQVCDLIGEDPPFDAALRPTVRAAMERCEPGQLVAARQAGLNVVVVGLDDGRTCVMRDECPHYGVALSEGYLEDGLLVCPRHGWRFDPETGHRVMGA